MMITSCIDGRIRVRDGLLQNPALVEPLRRLLLATPGVREVSANPRVGSLLVLFQKAESTLREIVALLERFLPGEKPAPSRPATRARAARPRQRNFNAVKRQAVNLGMLASLLLSLLGAVLGAKTLHIMAGIIFLGLFGLHFFDKKHFLFSFGGR